MIKLIGAGARPGRAPVERNVIVTAPNAVTLLRFLIAPLFCYVLVGQDNYGMSIVLLMLFGASDWVDGYLARRFNQASKLGRFLDPIADRLSLAAILAALAMTHIVPWFVIVGIVGVDTILALTSLTASKALPELAVTTVGKVRTALLMVGTLLVLASYVPGMGNAILRFFSYGVFYAGCIGHIWAGTGYFLTLLGKKAASDEARAFPALQKSNKTD